MKFLSSVSGGGLLLMASAVVLGQSLPATAPTQTQPQRVTAAQVPQAKIPVAQAPRRAHVEVTAGVVAVSANDSSLNQILREIGRLTGMKITGGVTDERVFGQYGPGDTSSVLTALLDGTGSNMMLVLDGAAVPRELVLTPRNGGPTPPNPNATQGAEREQEDFPMRMPRGVRPDGTAFVPVPVPQQPPQAVPEIPAAQNAPGPPAMPAESGTGGTMQQSPNGIKSPQQIYDQLMEMQQQQQKKPQ